MDGSMILTPQLLSPKRLSGLALVMLAAILWATVGVASELVPPQHAIPRDAYGLVRALVASPVILLIALAIGGLPSVTPKHGSGSSFLAFGICCAIFQICLFRSFELLGVTITVFLTVCLPPVIAIAWTALRRAEAISLPIVVAFALAALGLFVFVRDDFVGAGGTSTAAGVMLSFAAAVAFVLMTAVGRNLTASHSPLLVAGLGLLVAAIVLFAVVFLTVPDAMEVLVSAAESWRDAGLMLYLGLGPTALAYICYCTGMARCKTALAGLVASMVEPAVAAILALVLLNESLTSWQALGCGLMLISMLILGIGDRAESTPRQRPGHGRNETARSMAR